MSPPNKTGPSGKSVSSNTLLKPKVGGSSSGSSHSAIPIPQKTSEQRAQNRQLPILRQGSLGPGVQRLQRLLNSRISPSPELTLDGHFGPRTFEVVLQYQRGVR